MPGAALPHRQPARRRRPRRRGPAARRRRRCAPAASRFRVERTRRWTHARELARGALAAGEVAVAIGGDGLTRRRRRRAARDRRRARRPPRRPRQRLRPQARASRPSPSAAGDVLAAGASAPSTSPRPTAGPFLGIACAGLRLRRPGHRERTRLPLGGAVYALRDAARAARLAATPSWTSRSTARRATFTGYSVAVANSGVFGGGMQLVPDARARRRPARRRAHARRARSGASCAASRGSSTARTSTSPNLDVPARRARSAFHADRPVRRLRRRRPDRATCRRRSAVRPRALQVLAP